MIDKRQVPSKDFDALYAEANNQHMYQRWYTSALKPHMVTDLIAMHPLEPQLLRSFLACLKAIMESGHDTPFDTEDARILTNSIEAMLLTDASPYIIRNVSTNRLSPPQAQAAVR